MGHGRARRLGRRPRGRAGGDGSVRTGRASARPRGECRRVRDDIGAGALQRASGDRLRGRARTGRPPVPGGARAVVAGLACGPGDCRTALPGAACGRRGGGVERRGAALGRRRAARAPVERGGGMTPRVAVIQFPGVNCEAETVRALQRLGMRAEVFRSTRSPGDLREYQAYVLPGGFSYQDRVRAGALAAKDPVVEVLAEQAEQGKPVLGICNGAQILVESGMIPDGRGVELGLARNHMPDRSGYYARWIYLRVEPSSCVFTRALDPGTVLPLPVAHGEGRFAG